MSLKPLVFVAMPFGRKTDPSERHAIDFDDIYDRAVVPAAAEAGVDVIRADEEQYGGLIHVAMYERLLLAEIVLADLTLSNPNVFYELGVRHAARPRSTILMFAKVSRLPFDVSPMRAIPYELEAGRLTDAAASSLVETLRQKVEVAKTESEHTDSPLFQLLPGLQPLRLPHEVTESFRNRVILAAGIRQRMQAAVRQHGHPEALKELRAIQKEICGPGGCPPELLIDLMLAFREISAWADMISCIEAFPPDVQKIVTVQEQLGLALNRRNGPGDRARAIQILRGVIQEHGPSPETYGILGRVYKDRYSELSEGGQNAQAAAALEEAITCYVQGFEADPRDYYPGINAITLSLLQDTDEARARVRGLVPVVSFAVARRGGLSSKDYWDVATAFELAVIGQDWPTAKRGAGRLCMFAEGAWTLETTAKNLSLIRRWLEAQGLSVDPIDELIGMLNNRASEIKQGRPSKA